MAESCRQAQGLGLPGLAFTDHADYSTLSGGSRLQLDGYQEALASCRRAFPGLAIMSGVELGEPHRFPDEAAALLARGEFDLVLGSVHSVVSDRAEIEFSELDPSEPGPPPGLVREYFLELLRLIDGPVDFEVLAHLEYPKRFWGPSWPRYRSLDYQDELRQVLAAAARRGLVLELNTTRGGDPDRVLCPSPAVLRWWREAGGRRVSLGSDAHDPSTVAGGFHLAAEAASAAGFDPSPGRVGIWAASVPAGEGLPIPAGAELAVSPAAVVESRAHNRITKATTRTSTKTRFPQESGW